MSINTPTPENGMVSVDFEVVAEPWTIVRLADGTQIRVRLNMTEVFAILSPNGEHVPGPDGKPSYAVNWQAVTFVSQPNAPRPTNG